MWGRGGRNWQLPTYLTHIRDDRGILAALCGAYSEGAGWHFLCQRIETFHELNGFFATGELASRLQNLP